MQSHESISMSDGLEEPDLCMLHAYDDTRDCSKTS